MLFPVRFLWAFYMLPVSGSITRSQLSNSSAAFFPGAAAESRVQFLLLPHALLLHPPDTSIGWTDAPLLRSLGPRPTGPLIAARDPRTSRAEPLLRSVC